MIMVIFVFMIMVIFARRCEHFAAFSSVVVLRGIGHQFFRI